MKKLNIITSNPEETRVLAIKFSASLKSGDVILLHGNLGAGKTTFFSLLLDNEKILDKLIKICYNIYYEYFEIFYWFIP